MHNFNSPTKDNKKVTSGRRSGSVEKPLVLVAEDDFSESSSYEDSSITSQGTQGEGELSKQGLEQITKQMGLATSQEQTIEQLQL